MNALDVFGTSESRAEESGAQQGGGSKKVGNAHLGIRSIRWLPLFLRLAKQQNIMLSLVAGEWKFLPNKP
jgi:hypothetical protein